MKTEIKKSKVTVTDTCTSSTRYTEITKIIERAGYMTDDKNQGEGKIEIEKKERIFKGSLDDICTKLLNASVNDHTRFHCGTLSDVNNDNAWLLKVYGRVHLHNLTLLAEELSKKYDIKIEVILKTEDWRYAKLAPLP